tara:strand:+ start:624 stop:929 length:306 start_codon:yes stop_codon:yes gene_type:complete
VRNYFKKNLVRFKKAEINEIMDLYSKKISIGEWKDYSISFKDDQAIFSIHKSHKLGPIFQIKKNKNKNFFVLNKQNNTIKTSGSLKNLLQYLKKPSLKLVK